MKYTNYANPSPKISKSSERLGKFEQLDFSKGLNTFFANDVVKPEFIRYATDARISTLGRYETKKGSNFYTNGAGETVDTVQTSVTGASDATFTTTTWKGAKFTCTTTGKLTKVELNLKYVTSTGGDIIVEIRSDDSGSPSSTILAQSSIPASDLGTSYAYEVARFIEAPTLTATVAYWIVAYAQNNGDITYYWSSTTNATTAKTSANSGVSWSATAYDLNFKTYISTNSKTIGLYRAYKSDGTKTTLLASKQDLYTVNDGTGALSSIKGSLSSSATDYNFAVANDTVYYVNGYDAPRKWDFTTEAVCGGSPATSKDIILHKNQMFYLSASDPNKVFWSDIGDFETFTSTNFVYVPSTKNPEAIIGMAVLNDVLYFFTEKNKYALYGNDIGDFELVKPPASKGCVAKNTIKAGKNCLYFLSDDGLYRFNGSSDELISAQVTDIVTEMSTKSNCCGAVANNRYYLFYTPSGESANSKCLVYNENFKSYESIDTGMYISRTDVFKPGSDNAYFIGGSSLVGQAFYLDYSSNTYNNLGKKLTFDLRTRYEHFDRPSAVKYVKRWYPRFGTTTSSYSITLGLDFDFRDSPTTQTLNLQAEGITFGSGELFGSGAVFGSDDIKLTRQDTSGEANYIQFRYQNVGVNQPIEFMGHTIFFKTKRSK